jgi:hypothetical protein
MSTQIHINSSNLEAQINVLKNMESRWTAMNTTPPATVGGGASCNELELIGNLYHDIHTTMVQLIENTIGFMENTKKSFENSDQTTARLMENK